MAENKRINNNPSSQKKSPHRYSTGESNHSFGNTNNNDADGSQEHNSTYNRVNSTPVNDPNSNAAEGDYDNTQLGNSGTYAGNFGLNYEGPNYRRDRNWWDRSKDEVSSWFGDSDAERRRSIDKLIGDHRGKNLVGNQRSDECIREDICNRLIEDDKVEAAEIEVNVEESKITLSGFAKSTEEKRRAEEIAASVAGVRNIENRLQISRPDDNATTAGTDKSG